MVLSGIIMGVFHKICSISKTRMIQMISIGDCIRESNQNRIQWFLTICVLPRKSNLTMIFHGQSSSGTIRFLMIFWMDISHFSLHRPLQSLIASKSSNVCLIYTIHVFATSSLSKAPNITQDIWSHTSYGIWYNPFLLILNVPLILKTGIHLQFPKISVWPIWLLIDPL